MSSYADDHHTEHVEHSIHLVLLGLEQDWQNSKHEHCSCQETQQGAFSLFIVRMIILIIKKIVEICGSFLLSLPIRSPKGFRPNP